MRVSPTFVLTPRCYGQYNCLPVIDLCDEAFLAQVLETSLCTHLQKTNKTMLYVQMCRLVFCSLSICVVCELVGRFEVALSLLERVSGAEPLINF